MITTTDTARQDNRSAVNRLAQFYEHLTPINLQQLDQYYAPDARFKDPFNHVQGIPAIATIFEHMFATLDTPRFVVIEQLAQGDQGFLAWQFHFRFRRWSRHTEQCIHGATHVRLDAQHLVVQHRDYWDAAEELYEKIPGLGSMMRWLRYRASH